MVAFHDGVGVSYVEVPRVFRTLVGNRPGFSRGVIRQRWHSNAFQCLDDFRIAIVRIVKPQFDAKSLDESTPPLFIKMSR